MDKDYVVVTTVSSFRIRYVMHKEDLLKLNTDVDPSDVDLTEWAKDCVTCDEVDEFSQEHLYETIIDTDEATEAEMLARFDRENDYLQKWDPERKIRWVRNNLKTKEDEK